MKKSEHETIHTLFQPTFGNRPEQYIGRDGVIEQYMELLFAVPYLSDYLREY